MSGAFNPLPPQNLPDTINLNIDPNNLQSIEISSVITTPSSRGGGSKKNKYELINHYKKDELVKLATHFNIVVKNKDGSKKNKEELFKILHKKKIV